MLCNGTAPTALCGLVLAFALGGAARGGEGAGTSGSGSGPAMPGPISLEAFTIPPRSATAASGGRDAPLPLPRDVRALDPIEYPELPAAPASPEWLDSLSLFTGAEPPPLPAPSASPPPMEAPADKTADADKVADRVADKTSAPAAPSLAAKETKTPAAAQVPNAAPRAKPAAVHKVIVPSSTPVNVDAAVVVAGTSAKDAVLRADADTAAAATAKDESVAVPGAVAMDAIDTPPAAAVPEDRILCTIGNRPLRESDLAQVVMAGYGEQTLSEMLTLVLLYRAINDRGWNIAPEEELACLERHLATLSGGRPLDDPDSFLRQRTGLSLLDYRRRVVWPELALRRLIDVYNPPTSEEIVAYLRAHPGRYAQPEKARLAHLLIAPAAYLPPPPHPQAVGEAEWGQARQVVDDLVRRLADGEDFGKLAQVFSHDVRTAAQGGELGFLSRNELDRTLADAAFALSPGRVGKPIRSELGYHLFLMRERRPASRPDGTEPGLIERVREDCLVDSFRERSRRVLAALRAEAVEKGQIPADAAAAGGGAH